MRIALFIFLCTLRGLAEASVVDVYLDMDGGPANSSVTSNLLASATHGVGGSWSTIRGSQVAPLTAMKVTAEFEPLLGTPVEAGSITYTDRGIGSGYVFRNSTDREFARYTFDITHSKVSVGCFVRIGDFDGSTFGSYDLIALEGDGEFMVLNFQDFPGANFVMQIHTQSGTHDPIPVTPNTTYWMTLLWDQPGRRAYLKMYGASTWELLGSSSIKMENKACEAVCFGRYDDHGVTSPANHYFDDLMIDISTASFPILPSRTGPSEAPISLSIDGDGVVSGASNDSVLEIGRAYTLTAKPATGNFFAGWTGSTSSPSATLKFAMATNTEFTAHFVTNHFPEFKGTYAGLFHDASAPEQRSSGYMSMSLGSAGSYSAKVFLNGKSHSGFGTLAPDGTGTCLIKRTGTNALELVLRLDLLEGTERVEGSISEQTTEGVLWSAGLLLNRSAYSRENPAPQSGRYTIAVLPDSGVPDSPRGESVGSLTLSPSGTLTFAGKLADGTRCSQRTFISKSGDWPLYASLYAGRNILLSRASLDTQQLTTDISGNLYWFRQAVSGAKSYSGGFTNVTSLIGSRYLPPSATNGLLNLPGGTIEFSFDNISTAFSNQIQLSTSSKILNQSANKLSVSVKKSTGLFSGSVVPPAGGKPISFSGALLQKQNLGAGFFLENNLSGNVILGE